MQEQPNEAVIIMCKCPQNHRAFGMRAERIGDKRWLVNWAFPIKESSAKREGYDQTSISGNLEFAEEYPGCPYCGGRSYIICGQCSRLSCQVIYNGYTTCEWCGNTGQIVAYAGEQISAGADV